MTTMTMATIKAISMASLSHCKINNTDDNNNEHNVGLGQH